MSRGTNICEILVVIFGLLIVAGLSSADSLQQDGVVLNTIGDRIRFGYVYKDDLVVDVPGAKLDCWDNGNGPVIDKTLESHRVPKETWLLQRRDQQTLPAKLEVSRLLPVQSANGCNWAWNLEFPEKIRTEATIPGAPSFLVHPSRIASEGLKLQLLFSGTPEPYCEQVNRASDGTSKIIRQPTNREEVKRIDGYELELRSKDYPPRDGMVCLNVSRNQKAIPPFDSNYIVAVCNPAACGDTAAFQVWWATGDEECWCILLGSDGSSIYCIKDEMARFELESSFYKGP